MRWLADNCGQFHSAAALAQISGVSVRTVKSEIAAIRQEINSSAVMELIAVPSKGYQLLIHDPQQAALLLKHIQNPPQSASLNEQPMRIKIDFVEVCSIIPAMSVSVDCSPAEHLGFHAVS